MVLLNFKLCKHNFYAVYLNIFNELNLITSFVMRVQIYTAFSIPQTLNYKKIDYLSTMIIFLI